MVGLVSGVEVSSKKTKIILSVMVSYLLLLVRWWLSLLLLLLIGGRALIAGASLFPG